MNENPQRIDFDGQNFARLVAIFQEFQVLWLLFLHLHFFLTEVELVEVRPGGDAVRRERGDQEDHGGDEAEEAAHLSRGPESEEDNIAATGEDSPDCLATEDCAHVGWREPAGHPEYSSLEYRSIGVDEDNRDESEDEEGVLPGVGVHHDHDAGEDEQQDDEDQADDQARLSLELVAEESVEDEKGHVGHHGSGSQVASPRFLDIIGFVFANGIVCRRVRDVLCSQLGDIECAELGIPVSNNLKDINKNITTSHQTVLGRLQAGEKYCIC